MCIYICALVLFGFTFSPDSLSLFVSCGNKFPDELLKDSMRVVKALRQELNSSVNLYVMADTTYGSCCVDEVGAAHVNAECVIHYGHTCLSP